MNTTQAPLQVYLAGKIEKHGWRETVVQGLDGAHDVSEIEEMWPILQCAVFGHNYCGPFFVSCDHGCYHKPSDHGVGVSSGGCGFEGYTRSMAFDRCLQAIRTANVVFAWIDTRDCYGTLVELGFAHALGKEIVIGLPIDRDDHELWFSMMTATRIIHAHNPYEALMIALPKIDPEV